MPVTSRHPRRTGPCDERGSSLVLALAMIIVISIAGVAVLGQVSNAPSAQSAYEKIRTIEGNADDAVNNLVHKIRTDPDAAIAHSQGGSGTCNNDASIGTALIANKPLDDAGGKKVDIFCEADPNSGGLNGDSPNASSTSILTLGGVKTNKLPYVSGGSLLSQSGVTGAMYCGGTGCAPANKLPSAWVPFCNDYHDYQATKLTNPDKCEAGIYIGRGVAESTSTATDQCSTPPCPGGLVVKSTGALDHSAPLVMSNSSIIVSQVSNVNGVVPRELDVIDGSIWARAGCGWGAGFNSSGFLNNVFANYDAGADTGQPDKLHCINSGYAWKSPTDTTPPDTPTVSVPGSMANEPLYPDPDYVHEPIDISRLPIVNEAAASASCSYGIASGNWSAGAPIPRTPCSSNTCWNPKTQHNDASCTLDPNATGSGTGNTGCGNGFMVMPAARLYNTDGTPAKQPATVDGHVDPNHDVYGAWYDSAAALNTLMSTCSDTLYWFRPGIYYFDFQDIAGLASFGGAAATEWDSAKGCFPINCTSALSELVGGTPPGWYPGNTDSSTMGWNPCVDPSTGYFGGSLAAIQSCQQPLTELNPQNSKLPTNSQMQNPAAGVSIDDTASIAQLYFGSNGSHSNSQDGLIWDALQTPLPQNIASNATQNITQVQKLTFDVGYILPGNQADLDTLSHGGTVPDSEYAAYYDDPPGNDNYPSPTKHGAEIQFKIANLNGGFCSVYIPPGAHGARDPQQASSPTIGSPITIDLSHGCNPSTIDPSSQGLAIDRIGSGFPCGTVTDWTSKGYSAPPCTSISDHDFSLRPDWVNTLSATFNTQVLSSVTNSNPTKVGLVVINGARYHAQWIGRPAPRFPGGCDRARPGVQWMFGGSGYVNWGTSSTRSMFAELCASRQNTFPNWTNDSACVGYPNSTADPSRCYLTGPGYDFGIGLYGTAPDAAGPPAVLDTQLAPASSFPYVAADSTTGSSSGGSPWMDTTGTHAGNARYGPDTSRLINSAGNTPVSTVLSSTQWSNATLSFKLPTDIVGNGPNQIPEGALINQVRAVVYHREGTVVDSGGAGGCGYNTFNGSPVWSTGNGGTITYKTTLPHGLVAGDVVNINGFVPAGYNQNYATVASTPDNYTFVVYNSGTKPNPVTAYGEIVRPLTPSELGTPASKPGCYLSNAAGDIRGLDLKISAGIANANASNGYQSQNWDTNANGSRVQSTNGPPICTAFLGDSSYGSFTNTDWPTTTAKNTETGIANSGCPFTWGNINSVQDNPDSTGTDWTYQRDLTDSINSPEALNGAEVTWSVSMTKNTSIKQADLLGFRLIVTYRGVAAKGANPNAVAVGPRPLRGCMTTRAAWPNGYLVPGADPTKPALAARHYDWLDPDWGTAKSLSAAQPMQNDDAYGNDSASPGGTADKADAQDCAMIRIDNGSGARIKFHISGTIYTPSAALALTANDNDAEWATDGIVARHLTALKWKNNGDIAAVGDNPEPRKNRQFTIYVCEAGSNCSSSSKIVLKSVIVIDDQERTNPGHAVDTVSWLRCQREGVTCAGPP